MKYEKTEIYRPTEDALARVKTCGNITEIMTTEHRSAGGYTRKLDKDTYLDTRSGEVKEFEHHTTRAQDMNGVSRSLAQGRDLLNTNVTDPTHCRWMTLTYAENMTDPERLKDDFKRFNQRCRRKYGRYEYITAAEPQGRGAWHLHAVLIFPDKAPYMENAAVAEMWGQGFVTIKRLDDVDNVGAYLSAYLGDWEVPEDMDDLPTGALHALGEVKQVEYTAEDGTPRTKRYIKGGRIQLYPAQFHIFRWSKGIKMPTITNTTYGKAKEQMGAATPTYSKAVQMSDEEADYTNTLYYEYYNTKRDESQVSVDLSDAPW